MKSFAITIRGLSAAWLLAGVTGLSSLANAENVPSADTAGANVIQSVFVLPDNPNEGRDPFFPNSMRPYQGRTKTPVVTAISYLKLEGFSRSGGNVFVIINGVTFGVGDDGEVRTPHGKVHVVCKQIEGNSVVVEADGQILTLTLSNQ